MNLVYPNEMFMHRPEMMYEDIDSTPLTFVNSAHQFNEMMIDIAQVSEIAVDLEHHDYRSYQGFTCLMQISTRKHDYIVDCLEVRAEMHQLNHIYANPRVVKVFHGAESDVQWLQKDFGVYIVNLFDTFHASKVLSLRQHGLAFLLDHYCSIQTDKKHQMADWRKRFIKL